MSWGLAVRQCHLVTKRVASVDFAGPTRSHPALPWYLADQSRNRIELPQRVPEKPACSKPEARSEGGLLDGDACSYGHIREALLSADTRFRWKIARLHAGNISLIFLDGRASGCIHSSFAT